DSAAPSLTPPGRGDFKPARTTAEVAVRGATAYTTTWGNPAAVASVFYIWDVAGQAPRLVDSVRVEGATTLGDVAVSDDGSLLVVATERSNGGIAIYSLADARHPVLVSRYITANTADGVHTAEIGRVNGRLYGFLSIDPGTSRPAHLVIVDLGTPSAPAEVFNRDIGRPFVHDTFVRDGLLFLALWDDGLAIWDIGGGGAGGTIAAPVELGRVRTVNGEVHNVWWLKDPVTGITRYAFVGEEGAGQVGASSSGDVHVVDISVVGAPREVARYTVPGAGTHNFSVDEQRGILYAAYYNGGVRSLDVRGDLGTCSDAQRSTPPNGAVPLCDLTKMGRELRVDLVDGANPAYVWGVQYLDGAVYASDMLNGLWKLPAVVRP
ncbi:MAG: LVIVD repeat-containing protein, partial [Gemmatimonadales bacterium]